MVELQSVLEQLDDARRRLSGVPESMQELHEQYTEKKALIDECDERVAQAEQERRAAEGSAAEAREKASHYQQQISQVTTQREYGALLSEIDGAKTKASEFEDVAIAALEEIESANSQKAEVQQEFEAIDGQYQVEMQKWEEEKPQVAEQIDRLEAEADVLRAKLPKPLLLAYQRLYDRHQGKPLAKIEPVERSGPSQWRCSACNYAIRPQVVVQLRAANELVACGCGRQLYIDPADT